MYPCAKLKLDQLFLQWLSLPDSQQLVSNAFLAARRAAVQFRSAWLQTWQQLF
jgi:hypothetical protein